MGGGWLGGGVAGREGRVGSRRRVKATTEAQRAALCLQFVAQTDKIHKVGQDWCEEQPGTPYSPINAPQDHEIKCTLVVSQHRQKAACKSRPDNLSSSTWCF